MYVLNGWNRKEGELEQFFTLNEREAAIAIGRSWHNLGWTPTLKCYRNGCHIVNLYPLPLRLAA